MNCLLLYSGEKLELKLCMHKIPFGNSGHNYYWVFLFMYISYTNLIGLECITFNIIHSNV